MCNCECGCAISAAYKVEAVRMFCVKYNLFTCGCVSAYNRMFELIRAGASAEVVAGIIYCNSDPEMCFEAHDGSSEISMCFPDGDISLERLTSALEVMLDDVNEDAEYEDEDEYEDGAYDDYYEEEEEGVVYIEDEDDSEDHGDGEDCEDV